MNRSSERRFTSSEDAPMPGRTPFAHRMEIPDPHALGARTGIMVNLVEI